MRFGIDVSSNQHPNGAAINWAAAVAELRAMSGGAEPFVIVKATQGDWYSNPYFASDVRGARAAGAAVAAYLMDEGNAEPGSEEGFFRQIAGTLPQFDDDEIPQSSPDYAVHCEALLAQNPAAGEYLNQTEENEGFPLSKVLWEANYNNNPGQVHEPTTIIHQYWDRGIIAGIPGVVDLNAFLSTDAVFNEVFHLTTPTPIPVPVKKLAAPIVKGVPIGDAYYLVGADGGVFAFNGPPIISTLPNMKLARPIIDAFAFGKGLVLVGADGGTFSLGGAPNHGSIPEMGIAPADTTI